MKLELEFGQIEVGDWVIPKNRPGEWFVCTREDTFDMAVYAETEAPPTPAFIKDFWPVAGRPNEGERGFYAWTTTEKRATEEFLGWCTGMPTPWYITEMRARVRWTGGEGAKT